MRRRYSFGPKLRLKKKTIVSIAGIFLILISSLSLIARFFSGSILDLFQLLFDGLFGFLGPIFSLAGIAAGANLLKIGGKYLANNVILGGVIAAISILAVSAAFTTSSGLVGSILWDIISGIFTKFGGFLISAATFLAGFLIFANTSLDTVIGFFPNIFNFLRKKIPRFSLPKLTERTSFEKPVVQTPAKSEPQAESKPLTSPIKSLKLTRSGGIWQHPPLSLLSDSVAGKPDVGDPREVAGKIEKTLASFGIEGKVVEYNLGPAVTQFAIAIPPGVKISKITALATDLALALATPTGTVRIEAPIPGKSLIGIEIPNRGLEVVTLKSVLSADIMQQNRSKLAVALGKDVAGKPVVADISKMPHVLIAGATGSGKSVLINSMIASVLFRAAPTEVKFILVDPKRVELSEYNNIPHLLTPVIVDLEKILSSLKWAMAEMDRRYKLFAQSGVRNISGYNEMAGFTSLPYILIIIDELADLMSFAPVEIEDAICRLAQMARATGIHLVVATQRPSVDVITGLIKANITCRIAFNVASMVDSKVIIDQPGAEKLLGRGDMLYLPPDYPKPARIQGVYVSDSELDKLIEYLKATGVQPEYVGEVTEMPFVTGSRAGTGIKDELFEEAVRTICQYDRASASLLQRRLRIGYARAARLLDELESAGIVGPGEGAKPRDVLVRNAEEFLAKI